MKKTLAFALALFTAVSAAACTPKPIEYEEEVNDNGKKEAARSLEGFMIGFCDLDLTEMSGYCNIDLVDEIGYANLQGHLWDTYYDYFGSNENYGEVANEFLYFVESISDSILDRFSYEIGEGAYSNGKWIFDVRLEYLSVGSALDIFGEESIKLVKEIERRYEGELKSASESEKEEIYCEQLSELFIELPDIFNDACVAAEGSATDCKLTVVLEDGEWIVDGNDGKLGPVYKTME